MKSKTNNGFLSFISWISMIGLIIGVAALIIVTSVLNGFEVTLRNNILGMVPHATIESSAPIKNWQDLASKIQDENSNVVGYAPFVELRGMTSINGNVHGTVINGIDSRYQNDVSILHNSMVEGKLSALTKGSKNIVLGLELVEKNSLKIGDVVTLFVSKPSTEVSGITPIVSNFTLVGVFSSTTKVEEWMSYVAIDDASTLNKQTAGVRGIRLNFNDVMAADKIIKNIESIVPKIDNQHYQYYHWKQSHGGLYETIMMQKNTAALLLFLIILVAVFNIVSTLILLITEKKVDIAILKTYGASSSIIRKIFVIQGLVIGFFGTTIGLVVGISITLVLGDITQFFNTTFNLNLFEKYYTNSLVIDIKWLEIMCICFSSLLVTVISTLYPAHIASKIEPARTLNSH